MKKIYISCFMLLATISIGYGQFSFNDYVKGGDQAMSNSNYNGALTNYAKALEISEDSAELWYKFGKAAFSQNAYARAEQAFTRYLADFEEDNQSSALYYLASAQHLQGKYEDAINSYNSFLTEYPDVEDLTLKKKVEMGLSSAQWAQNESLTNPDIIVNPLGNDVNTPYSEQGPYFLDDKLYFHSLKYPYGKKKDKTLLSKILVNENQESIPLENTVSNEDEGILVSNPSFNNDGTIMAFTKCSYGFQDIIECDLYYALKGSDGKFREPKAMPSSINMTGYTATQPCFRSDDNLDILYFASNRPGGKGGLDIWMSSFNNFMVFTTPVNVDINTTSDDITPFYHQPSKTLYFSSNGRDGFGGFDIYKNIGETITNAGPSINTSYNDIYYYLNEDGVMGYLSSNRKGSQYLDDSYETCCYDIFEVEHTDASIDINLLVFDKITNAGINGTRMVITDISTGEVIYDSENPNANIHKLKIRCDREYRVELFKDGYSDSSSNIGPYTDDCGKGPIEEKLYMMPGAIDLTINTFDKTTGEALDYTEVKLVCLTTGQEIGKSTGSTNQVRFALDPTCTNYRILGFHDGYESANLDFTTQGLSGSISKDLYLTKTQIATLEGLVPVKLYFDHDHPNPSSNKSNTNLWYSETFEKYYPRKEVFASKYSAINTETNRQQVNSFFENEVKRGSDNLQLMLETLLEVMKSGQQVNLYLRGYASPIAEDEYNYRLGERRVNSVRNEIRKWDGGILVQYINDGQLVITERSFGETAAPKDISDKGSEALNSIYSPFASRERRVEIDEINFDN